MKRTLLVCVISILVMGVGSAWEGAPLSGYTMKKTKNQSLHQFSENATTIDYLQQGDTLGYSGDKGEFDEYFSNIVLLGTTARKKVQAGESVKTDLRPIGFNFPLNSQVFTHFALSGNGSVYFGTAQGVTPGVASHNFGKGNGGNYIYNSIVRNTKKYTNMQDGRLEPGTYIVAENTKIQYEVVDGVLYIGYQNLLVHDTSGKANLTASFQYEIKSSGEVSLLVENLTPIKENRYFFRLGLQSKPATGSNSIQYLYDWSGKLNNANCPQLPLGAQSDSLKLNKFTYTPPLPCAAVSGMTINVAPYIVSYVDKIDISYGFTWTKTKAEALLMVLSKSETAMKNQLQDGRVYVDTDKIDDCPVRVGTNYFIAFDNLESNTQYYLHIFPYRTTCSSGPVYGQEVIVPAKTALPPLTGMEVTGVDKNSVGLKIKKQKTDKVVLGVCSKPIEGYNIATNVLKSGTVYAAGNEVDCNGNKIRVLEVNTTDSTFTINNLEAGKPHYFYAWAMADESTYSRDHVKVGERTVSTSPTQFDFSETQQYAQPAGWSSSTAVVRGKVEPHFNIIADWGKPAYTIYSFHLNQQPSTPASVWAVSPWMEGSGNLAATFKIALYSFTQDPLDPKPVFYKKLKATDSVIFQMQEEGTTTWRTIGRLTVSSTWNGNGFNEITSGDFSSDKNFRFRALYYQSPKDAYGATNQIFAIESIKVEESRPCKYPHDIAVPAETLDHKSAKITWTDVNSPWAQSFVVGYKAEGESTIRRVSVDKTEAVLTELTDNTGYTVEVRAVCSAQDTSIVKTTVFRTAYAIPYVWKQLDESVRSMDQTDFLARSGLPGENLSATSGESGWSIIDGVNDVPAFGMSLSKVSLAWLQMPGMYSERNGKVEISFNTATFDNTTNGWVAATGIEKDTLFVFHSTSGSFTKNNQIGFVVLDHLTTRPRTFRMEFEVNAGDKNTIGFYLSRIKDKDNEDNYSQLLLDSVNLKYTAIYYPAVTNLRSSGLGKKSVTISWKGSALSYAILLKKRSAEKYDTTFTSQTEHSYTNLESGTAYQYQVFGYYGESKTLAGLMSEVRYFTTLRECKAPTGLSVINITWRRATLVCPQLNEGAARQIYIERPANGASFLGGWVGKRPDTCLVDGLYAFGENGEKVTLLAAVRDACGPGDTTAWSEKVEFTTIDPPFCGTPTDLKSVYNPDTRSATLSWKSGENNQGFYVYSKKEGARVYDTAETFTNTYRLQNIVANTVYYWLLEAFCDDYIISRPTQKEEIITKVANEKRSYAAALQIRMEGRQLTVFNPEHRTIKQLKVYDASGLLLKTYQVNTNDNVYIYTDLHQGMVLIEAVGNANESAAVKAVVM